MGKYLVWCPDISGTEDDARVFEAHSMEDAAAAWAKWEDSYSADYWIVGGQTPTVCVRSCGGGQIIRFMVSGEQTAVYSTTLASAEGK